MIRYRENTYDKIYEALGERLNELGEIKTNESWVICRTKMSSSYSTIAQDFRNIMNTMVEQKKAVKVKHGVWKILKANTK